MLLYIHTYIFALTYRNNITLSHYTFIIYRWFEQEVVSASFTHSFSNQWPFIIYSINLPDRLLSHKSSSCYCYNPGCFPGCFLQVLLQSMNKKSGAALQEIRIFWEKRAMLLSSYYDSLSSWKKSWNSLEPFSRKSVN